LLDQEFAHSFADIDDSVHRKRQTIIKDFLLVNRR
jgi:hypothetical protein